MAKPFEGAVLVEGIRPGTRFRNSSGVWVNGTVCPSKMIAALRAEGYKLRAAKDGEVITDAAPVIASVSEKRPPPNNGPSTRKSGVADSSSTLLGGDEGEGAGDPEE